MAAPAVAGKQPVLWAHREVVKPLPYETAGELLIDAVRSGQEIRVRDALQKGADVNYMCQAPTHPPIWNIGAMTALMLATHRGDLPLVQLLLEKKADKNKVNHLGRRARDYAKDEKMRSLLE